MSDTTPQDSAAMPPASTGSLANAHSARQDAEAKIIADGIAEIMRIASEPDWIPVGERLPEEEDEVLVAWGLSVDVAIFRDGRWFRIPQELTKITHWMPLPEPPTDAK